MADLALLRSQLDALLVARASATRTVRFRASTGEEREVAYRTDAELAAAIADVEQRIATLSGASVRTIRLSASKGI